MAAGLPFGELRGRRHTAGNTVGQAPGQVGWGGRLAGIWALLEMQAESERGLLLERGFQARGTLGEKDKKDGRKGGGEGGNHPGPRGRWGGGPALLGAGELGHSFPFRVG